MLSSTKYNGTRRVAWIFALSGLIVFILFSLREDVTMERQVPKRIGGPHDQRPFAQIFPKIHFASAFKGAKSQAENYIDLERYLQNHRSYVKLYKMNEKMKVELSKYYFPKDVDEFLNSKVFSLRRTLLETLSNPIYKHSYEALALTALGPAGRRLVELCLLCFLVSSIVAFLVVIDKKSEEKAKKGVEEIKKDVEPGLEKAPKIKREDKMAKKEEETTETNKGMKKTEKGVDEKELRKEKEFMGPEKDEVKEFAKEEVKEPMGKEVVERKEKPQENDKFMKEKIKDFEAQGEEKKINLMEEKKAQIHMEEPREIKGVKVVNPDASMKTSKNGTDVVNGVESVKEKMKENIEVKGVKVVNPDESMKTSKNGTDVANGAESVKEKVKENIETVLEFRSSNSSWSHIKSGKESAAHIDV
ncbi:hypothetical protein RB195_007559 [Necator americanus]|uniref:Uncharacterized protein n=1 Tax=Necator americanus TaxID=51031 RepID=A0ABR1BXU5_NECAM